MEYVFLQIVTEKSDLEKLIPLLIHANSAVIVQNNKVHSFTMYYIVFMATVVTDVEPS